MPRIEGRPAATTSAVGTEGHVSFDQAAKYEKQAERCVKHSDEATDPAEQRLWLACA